MYLKLLISAFTSVSVNINTCMRIKLKGGEYFYESVFLTIPDMIRVRVRYQVCVGIF